MVTERQIFEFLEMGNAMARGRPAMTIEEVTENNRLWAKRLSKFLSEETQPPVQWNNPVGDTGPVWTNQCKDHPAVRRTSYDEVADILGTSGCSRTEPYWIHDVMGVIETPYGKLIVCPGDWIVESVKGVYSILTNEQYAKLYTV